MQDLINTLIRAEILGLSAYHVQDNKGQIKLDAMENPYSLPAGLVEKWLEVLRTARLNLYPDPAAKELNLKLKSTMQVPNGFELLLGNGSDELIQIMLLALAKPGAKVLSLEPTFVMYEMIARFCGLQYIKVELDSDLTINENILLQAVGKHKPEIIFIANPNNPSGNLFNREVLERVLQEAPGLVIIDEAYFSFTDESFMQDLEKYPDKLLIMRTVSKLGLAGLRLGLLAGHPDWIQEFNKVRLPYNINVLTQISAAFFLKHYAVFESQSQQIINERQSLFSQLDALEAITAYCSEANFILFKVPQGQADRIHTELINKGILIKNLNGSYNKKLKDCLRVTVGTEEENTIFLGALKEIL